MGKHGRTKQRRTLAEQYAWLDGREAMKQLPADLRRRRQHLLRRQRDKIERDAPSDPWADAVWEEAKDFPDGWVRCKKCGRFKPVNNAESDYCIDCQSDSSLFNDREHDLDEDDKRKKYPAGRGVLYISSREPVCMLMARMGIGMGVLGKYVKWRVRET